MPRKPAPKGKKPVKKQVAPKCEMIQIVPKKRKQRTNYIDSRSRTRFYQAYEATAGNISASSEIAGLKRLTVNRWLKSTRPINVKFQKRLEIIRPEDKFLDFAEAALMTEIGRGNITAIIFFLKTKGKERGYTEKTHDLDYQLTLRAVARLEKVFEQALSRDENFKPDIRRFCELAANDFGVEAEAVEKEYLKRQPLQLGDGK